MCAEAEMGLNGVELIHKVPIADLTILDNRLTISIKIV